MSEESGPAAPSRVLDAFTKFSSAISAKDRIPPPHIDPSMVSQSQLSDGSMATLWAGTESSSNSRCYHVDVVAADGISTFGFGACSASTAAVDLHRSGALVVGLVGDRQAVQVRVATSKGSATAIASNGVFLVPPDLQSGETERFTLEWLTDEGRILGRAEGLPAPGTAHDADPSEER